MDILVRVFRFKEQQLRRNQVGHVVFNGPDQENDALLEQTRIDVIGKLATGKLLDNHRDQAACGLDVRVLLIKRIAGHVSQRSEEHTSELQSLMRISYAVFCLKNKTNSILIQVHSNDLIIN